MITSPRRKSKPSSRPAWTAGTGSGCWSPGSPPAVYARMADGVREKGGEGSLDRKKNDSPSLASPFCSEVLSDLDPFLLTLAR